jgi:ATP-binding cassette subfamily B protein
LKTNITCSLDDIDEAKFQKAVEEAGLKEKIASLPQKENTYITQTFNLTGVQLSGGETQKMLLARALYKDAPLLVLDEPTAALDPLSEEAMYKQYLAFAKGNTSIFISHRLASTRFCDRIVYLENGAIEEIGTHDELVKNHQKYEEMFEIQAKYYREGGNDHGQEQSDAI